MTRKLHIILKSLLIIILFGVPFFLIGKIDTVSEKSVENRILTKFPSNSKLADFPKDFESYLNDRFGYRLFIVEKYRQVLIYLFGTIPRGILPEAYEGMILGDDNYLYHPGVQTALNWNNMCSETGQQQIARSLSEQFKEINQNKDFKFISSSIPVKEFFTFDKLPYYIRHYVDENELKYPWTMKIQNMLDDTVKHNALLPFNEFKTLNDMVEIYPNGNFHQVAKSPATWLYASMVAKQFGKIDNISFPDLTKYTKPCEEFSDISFLLGLKMKNNPFYCNSQDYFEEYGIESRKESSFESIPIVTIDNLKNKNENDTLLVIGNSFAEPILYDLAIYFRKIIKIHLNELAKVEEFKRLFDHYKPNYVLVAINGTSVQTLLPPDIIDVLKNASFFVKANQLLNNASSELTFTNGWSVMEKPEHRWSDRNNGKTANILFRIMNQNTFTGHITISATAYSQTDIKFSLNNTALKTVVNYKNGNIEIDFDPSLLKDNGTNDLQFEFSNAEKPSNGDPRVISITLHNIVFK